MKAKSDRPRPSGPISPNFVAGSRYSERLQQFIAGDTSAQVSDAFKIAFEAVGKARVEIKSLVPLERKALVSYDLRWERGPDGVLMWAAPAETSAGVENSPDCNWLHAAALNAWRELSGGLPTPPWMDDWCAVWSQWGYRYLSVLYDSAKLAASKRKSKRPASAAANTVAGAVGSLRIFFLEYLPKSKAVNASGAWPDPKMLLGTNSDLGAQVVMRDDFWNLCCAGRSRTTKVGNRSQRVNQVGSTLSVDVQNFLDFVSQRFGHNTHQRDNAEAIRLNCPFLPRTPFEVLLIRKSDGTYGKLPARTADKSCRWIGFDFPHLHAWESFAFEYIKEAQASVASKLNHLSVFFERYLSTAGQVGQPGQDLDAAVAAHPLKFLHVENASKVPQTLRAASVNPRLQREVFEFLEHILKFHCAEQDEEGLTRLQDFANPFSDADSPVGPSSSVAGFETLRAAMPYSWVRRHRMILVEGPHFGDWKWAQQAQQSQNGNSADWFEIDPSMIDKSDPDCVWRERTTGNEKSGTLRTFFELWSPVRWVSLLVKLNTALRTLQVRVLDSGESDRYRFDLKAWSASYAASLTTGKPIEPWVANDLQKRNPKLWAAVVPETELRRRGRQRESLEWSNGVLRRALTASADGWQSDVFLYVNTNKTADNKKEGAAKGFEVPLPLLPCPLRTDDRGEWIRPDFSSDRERLIWLSDLAENTHWWLAKLRDWQERYNSIERRAEWSELSGTRLISEKSNEKYSMYRPTCFLFREPSMGSSKLHPGPAYPVPDWVVGAAWWSLNKELQDRFAAEGRKNADGSMIRLVKDDSGLQNKTCEFDLHSIRVSLITALVVEGKVPIEIVQRLVGHSRILMTLYYTKLTNGQMQQALKTGMARLAETAVDAEKEFLRNASVEQIRDSSAYLDESSALAALGVSNHAAQRPVIAWVRVVGGICPVGAVARDTEGGLSAGCFNGGEHIGSGRYAPVTGGERNCVNCRWFITRPAFLGELVSMFEVAQYRAREADERAVKAAADHHAAISAEDDAHQSKQSPQTMAKLRLAVDQAERLCDSIGEQGISAKVTMGNAYRLIRRLLDVMNRRDAPQESDALVLSGGTGELTAILEETTSEMLQLARVTRHAEVFPELDPGKAILKASQIMARKLADDGVSPWLVLDLSEDERCRLTNGVIRELGMLLSPADEDQGFRRAVELIDGPESIANALGIKGSQMREFLAHCAGHQRTPFAPGIRLPLAKKLLEASA